MWQRTKVQQVTGVLRQAGFTAYKFDRRNGIRRGYKVSQFNPVIVSVDAAMTGEAQAKSEEYEVALVAAGFTVERIWPDATMLAVAKKK